MKQILSEEFIDSKLLTPKQKEEMERIQLYREQALENHLTHKQNELIEREDVLTEKMALAAGFDGYDTGECNYRDVYHQMMRDPLAVNSELREKYHKFQLSKYEGPFSDEYTQLQKDTKSLKTFESDQMVWLKQQYLNDVLTAIRPRAEKYKFDNGTRFPNANEYNKLSEEQKKAFRQPMSIDIKDTEGNDILIDQSIAGKVKRLWSMGVKTGASCSGMVQDHPYHRYEENDRFGRYKKGELMFLKPSTPRAYITFPVEENHPDMIAKTQQMAEKWGWVVDRLEIYGKDSIVLRPPHTLDGSSYTQISKEIEEDIEGIMAQYGLTDEAEAREDSRLNVEFNHGGRIMYTDRMLAYQWRQLTEGIGNIMFQINRDILKKNIEEGKAVKIYDFDARFVNLNAEQLSDIFRRSGIVLDKDSIPFEGLKAVGDDIWRMPRFKVCEGKARLMAKDEPMPDNTLLESRHNLSYLMATQIKGTVHTSEPNPYDYKITVMIHPDPKTIEQAEQFNLTRNLDSTEYYRMASENYDMTYLLASKFNNDLYRAAIDAYEQSVQRKTDKSDDIQIVGNVRIIQRMDGNTYISCSINDEKQMSKRLKPEDAEYYNMQKYNAGGDMKKVDAELAQKYYKSEIDIASLQQDRTKGRSR